jgi:hypothetical protein
MPLVNRFSLSTLAKVLIDDDYASKNDAQVLTRVVDAGHATRTDLDACIDLIEKSGLGDDKKKSALKELERFMAASATGIEAELFSAPTHLTEGLKREGIADLGALLEKARAPSQRFSLARDMGINEKSLRALVKQADLLRVDGMDAKLAKVLLDNGVDSVPELSNRNVDNLFNKLKDFAGSREAWIIQFKMPSKDDLRALIDGASQLDAVVEFGQPSSGFELLSMEERIRLMDDQDPSLENVPMDSLEELVNTHGLDNIGRIKEVLALNAMEVASGYLDYAGLADVPSAEDMASGAADPDVVDPTGSVYWSREPEVEAFTDQSGKLLGATITYGWTLEPAGYHQRYFYDHVEKRITGSSEYDSYNGEEVYGDTVHPGSPESGSATAISAMNFEKLAEDLVYISEGDEPWRRWAVDFEGDINAANVKKYLHDFNGIEIGISDPNEPDGFWEYYLDPQTYGAPEAQKYAALKTAMESELTDIRFIHIGKPGRVENEVYLMGKNADGMLVGLSSKSIET